VEYEGAEADDLSWIQGKTLLASSSKPKRIILFARNPKKADVIKEEVEQAGMQCNVVIADGLKPKEIIAGCREVEQLTDKLECIWNNAGNWSVDKDVTKQEDGIEVHFALNYIAMVLIVTELRELLQKSAPSRVVVTGSFTSWEMMKGVVHFDNLQCENGKHKLTVKQGFTYAHSKLLQHVWCKHYADLMPQGVTINVGDPGAVETNIELMNDFKKKLGCCFRCFKKVNAMRTPDVGCRPLLHMIGARAMDGVSGSYIDWGRKKPKLIKRKPVPMEFYPEFGMKVAPSTVDPKQCERLYLETEKIVEALRTAYGGRGGPK